MAAFGQKPIFALAKNGQGKNPGPGSWIQGLDLGQNPDLDPKNGTNFEPKSQNLPQPHPIWKKALFPNRMGLRPLFLKAAA